MEKYRNCNTVFCQRACALFGSMKQTQIAELTGLTQSAISKIMTCARDSWYESNTSPSAETVYKIAKAFNVSTDYLLGLTDVKTTKTATKELCSTLGLSEETIKILSADPSSAIGELWLDRLCDPLPSDEGKTKEEIIKSREEMMKGILNTTAIDVSFVFNQLIEEHIKNRTNHVESSLLDLMKRFYHSMNAVSLAIYEGDQYTPIESPLIVGVAKNGDKIILPVEMKDLVVSLTINDILTKLNNIKSQTLANNTTEK